LVVCCSSFSSQPSLAAHICNHYKLKTSIRSVNICGMGACDLLIGIDLASEMLQEKPSLHALVVSSDNCTQNFYYGNERDYLVSNTLWRWGCSAVLLTNCARDRPYCRFFLYILLVLSFFFFFFFLIGVWIYGNGKFLYFWYLSWYRSL
jgi:3-ketoacyl-CoA synthase